MTLNTTYTTAPVDDTWKDLEVDEDKLTAKYKEEREKRFRKEGSDQYNHAVENEELLAMTSDPFVEPNFSRNPVTKHADIVIVGGGVGGLFAACTLAKAGHKNILVIEKAGDFGGVWYWNRYPGIQIDIESYIYMPMLEDLGHIPSMKYSPGDEIREYLQSMGRHFGIYEQTLFQTEVRNMRWDESSSVCKIETSRGDTITSNWLVPSTGPFDEPKFPGIPGIESFKGHKFHSSRWDFDYTGGNAKGNLTKLSDKRVGIIGTGATGVQIIPHLGEASGQLFVFQRTPSSIDKRLNRQTDAEWFRSQPAGWQRARMDNFTRIITGVPQDTDLVSDGWTKTVASLNGWFGDDRVDKADDADETARLLQLADFRKMQSIRNRVDDTVKDKDTAEALKPYFNQYCKRPCFSDIYLPTFNRPNVKLVDTKGQGIDRITEKGVVANGEEYELDVIIFATGFEFATDWHIRHHANIYGKGGITISEKWKDGPATLHGWAVNGFPNAFFISSAQTSGSANYHHSLEDQVRHLNYIFTKWKSDKIKVLEADAKAEEEWLEEVLSVFKGRADYLNACTPGYYNDEGQVSAFTARNSPYSGGVEKFLDIVKDWREADRFAGLSLVYAN